MEAESLTRDRAINLINDAISRFTILYDGYCNNNWKHLTDEEREFYDQMYEVISILRDDEDYKHDLKNMPLADLKAFLLMCKEMLEHNSLSLKSKFPKGDFEIVEDEEPKTQRNEIASEDTITQEETSVASKLNGKTDLFTLFVNEVSQEIGNVIHIDEGMRITFRLEALDKEEKYKTDWESRKEGGTEEKSFYTLVSLIKNTADDDSMDREMTFEEIGEYKVSARVYKVMKQSLFASLKELVRDYEFKVVVDESDDLYATMDLFAKLLKALQDVSWKEVAAVSAEEVLKTLPMMVGTIIAVSAVLIALTMTPVGWLIPLVGTAMQVYGGANAAKDIAAGLYLFTDAVIQTKEAKSSGAMKQASALFTKAFKYVGPNLLMDFLMFFGGKAIKNVKGGNKIEATKPNIKPSVTTQKGKNGLTYKKDSNGRWHKPDGHYASNAELEQNGIMPKNSSNKKTKRKTSFAGNSPQHKAQKWEDYQAKGGKLKYEQWSKKYDTAIKNKKIGAKFEKKSFDKFKKKYKNAQNQVEVEFTLERGDKITLKLDAVGIDDKGNIVIQEYKSSATAGFTENQSTIYANRKEQFTLKTDGYIKNGKGDLVNMKLPKGTKVNVIRPGDKI
ncbi:MAG: hypothetical protein IJ530_04420 [Treponema sp.]|uniref:hypothetical protein n=1 Tax=Treponema sp. TaxID=166 RepID=UPI0025EFD19E|nr:hypothetical protein [Treponema sp.]MBQ8678990.1 hypothetical protein [Treponema sp.]